MQMTSVIHKDPDILGGTPVFVGTRVPLKTLIDYLESGLPLDEFLDDFPTVSREQAIAALKEAREALSDRARAA
ncbi:DUF433 domain-containing protein [Longimicrobium sp.]|uniref:DUF433 domain-containing protein n=1 Tax=Longimicrobium sp. TaxID=2029185 RepID=UPI002BF44E22|nr:DUF433 domain-containing protein [Longimicrobium sp.]HSU13967.1 DUF433 domain-containing protein [Longimicrobium sp.]